MNMRELTLHDALIAIWDRIIFVVLFSLAAAAAAAYVSWNVLPPVYTATTTLYVLSEYTQGSISYMDVNTSTLLVSDYQALASSSRVRAGAAEMVGIDNLDGFEITVDTQDSTRMIYVNVVGENPGETANVANAIAENLSVCILEVMKVENISVIDTAVPPNMPSGPDALKNTVLAGMCALVLSIGIVLFAEVANTRIRTNEDAEKLLNLPVLAQIPKMNKKQQCTNGRQHEKRK
jgi:capsular polysaccharide biosynthesis protein